MKKMNKLVALLLAAVMVLGLFPAMTAHATEYHTHGIEEYPAIALDTPTTVNVVPSEDGGSPVAEGYESNVAYFTFTPETTHAYHFYSAAVDGSWIDTKAAIYDAEMNQLAYGDDPEWGNSVGVSGSNFLITQELEAGQTYVLSAQFYGDSATGSFSVTLTAAHSYESAITKDYTCTEDGVLTWTCIYCGDSYDEPIPAAHKWAEETGICSVCNETYLIEGVCGDDLTWTLDWFGKLTISGTGDMYDFFYSWEENTPSEWYDNYRYDIKSVVIEEGCTSIGDYAFYQCDSMAEVSIPASVTDIGAHAFDNTALTAIEVPETVTTLGEGAFASNYNLASAKLPSGLTAIPASLFEYCGALTEVIWPDAATSIGAKAFYNCSLGDLVVPEGIAAIGASAFGGNSDMTKLILPSTLAVLEDRAFSSCWNVLDFVFTGSAPVIPEAAFNWVTANVWYPKNNTTWTADVMKDYGGTLTWKPMCANHAYSDWTVVEATCEVGEYQTRTCAACGWIESTVPGEPLGHDFVYTTIEPNCGTFEYGRTEITCTRCDYYSSENWVYPEHSYETVVTEATCTENGFTTYTCTACGSSYTDNYVYATGHVVESWSEPSEATCTEPSVKTGTCSVCGETATEEVSPALGHTWSEEGTPNEDGSLTYTCTVCGDTYQTEGTYLYLGDNAFTITGSSGGTTKTFTATETGKLTITINNMVYHNKQAYDNGWTDEYWQTLGISWCFSQGFFNVFLNDVNTAYNANGDHEVVLNTIEVNAGDVVTVDFNHQEGSYYYTNDVMCNMNLALESTHTHEYTPVVTEPTCTEGGYTTFTCACGDSYVADETEALGHEWKGTSCLRCDAKRENPFVDVPETSFYIDAVLWAVENGITNGADATHFNPTGSCLRAQVVTFLWRAMGEPEPTTTVNPFTDVSESNWYYKAVLWAVENGITNGLTATTFGPTAECNRAQVVTFLWRAEGEPAAASASEFTDVEAGKWYTDAINWAVENNITNGMGDGSFGIGQSCNRAQMVTFLYRTAQLPEAGEPEVDGEKYLVLLKAIGNGTIECDVTEAAAGQKVSFIATPDDGYAFARFQVFDPNGEIDLSGLNLSYGENENEYVFNMVAHDLIVDCVFEPAV